MRVESTEISLSPLVQPGVNSVSTHQFTILSLPSSTTKTQTRHRLGWTFPLLSNPLLNLRVSDFWSPQKELVPLSALHEYRLSLSSFHRRRSATFRQQARVKH